MRLSIPLAALMLMGCAQIEVPQSNDWPSVATEVLTANLRDRCAADFAPERDYFPEKVRFDHSTQLSVRYHGNYKLVRFNPGVDTGETQTFAFVQCGTPAPRDLPPHTVVVDVPIRRLATVNESMLGAMADLDVVHTLVGIPNKKAITVPAVKRHIAKGGVAEMYGYGHSSIEAILALDPDVYLSFYSAYPQFNMHPTLWRVGVKALPQADHLESTPLGRAEWIKFLALLTNREAGSNAVFAAIVSEYEAMRARVPANASRPRVLAGVASRRDIWDLFGGDNFRASLIRDAGGEFILQDARTANGYMMLPLERVYARAHDAPVWLGGLQGVSTFAELTDKNPMYPSLHAVRGRNVHAWDRGYLGYWSYPAIDQSMTRPQWLLEDAIRILHPSVLPPGEFHFARSLE